ncbi:phospholipase-like protein [Tanacetum coccineum]
MEDLIEVLDAKITIRSSLSFLTDVKKKIEEPGNEKRNTLFRATVFGKWLDIPAFANDNLLLNYIFHHQVSDAPSVDCPLITYSICGNSFEFGRKEFCLMTGFLFGKLPKKETYKGIPSSPFLDRIFPDRCTNRVKKVKGDELMILFTTDDLWFGISDHDAVRVCLLLVATNVFMGREARYYIPNNVLELVDDFPSWNTYPWGEYFWRIFYLRTLNVVPRKNERDSKKVKEKVVEPPKKKKKPAKCSKKKNKADEQSPKKITTYNLYDFVLSFKAIADIIDKRKGEVSTSCLEKELDIVKDRIAVLEKCFKLRYQDTSKDSVKQVCYKQHDFHCSKSDSAVSDVLHQEVASKKRDWPGEASGFIYAESQEKYSVSQLLQLVSNEKSGPVFDCTQLEVDTPIDWSLPNLNEPFSQSQICGSVGFDDMLDPRCKDHQLNDNVQKCLVNPVDMMCGELNKSDDKFDETVAVGVIVDRATLKASPPPNAMEYQEPQPTDKGSVGFDDLLDPGTKDHLLNDNVPKGLVKLVEPMSGEDNISDDKLDETVAGGVIVDRATLQASPPPNAMQYQEPHPTDKVDAAVFVDVQGKKVDSSELNCVNMNLPRSSEQIFKRMKRVTRKGKFGLPPYTPLPSITPILKKRQSNILKMNAIPMDNLDDDCQIIPLKYWLEDSTPFARTRKRNHTGYVKEPNTFVDCPDLPEIVVDPWVEVVATEGGYPTRHRYVVSSLMDTAYWLSEQ